jgi:hypothetical protein
MKSNERGLFEAEVSYRGKRVAMEDDGLLPSLQHGDEPNLIVRLLRQRTACITVDVDKQIQECEQRHDASGPYLLRTVTLPSVYEYNHIRVVAMSPTGLLTIDEVAIVGQGRKYFLTQQRVHDVQCYISSYGKLYIPRFCSTRPWPEFVEYLHAQLSQRTLACLPKMSAYREVASKQRTLGFHQAEVKWFNLAHRLGMARTGAGTDALIFGADVPQNGTRLRFLTAGQVIRFERLLPLENGSFSLKGLCIE